MELQLAMATCTLLATACAAWATWKGPQIAAKLAEQLRKTAQIEDEKRRMKLLVFATLMQERANIASPDAVKMLNLIDLVFIESKEVRDCWAELYAFCGSSAFHDNGVPERLRKLLKEMAINIGVESDLRADDFARIYYPNSHLERDLAESLNRRQTLSKLAGKSPNGNSFPPRPNQDQIA